ncbi:MAG: hypothetical protein NW226_19135 [Microscillaceae bacterium]|nr:hypothetical protein [Microscillaceae bacterium]
MSLAPDSKIVLIFYTVIILSLVFMFTFADQIQDQSTRKYIHLSMGLLWTFAGAFTSTYLPKIYKKTFWELQRREQRVILVAIIIAALGVFLVFRILIGL